MLTMNHFPPFPFIDIVVVILGEWFETGAVNAVAEIIEAFIDDPKLCEVGCKVLKMMLFGAGCKSCIFILHFHNKLTV